MSHADRYVNGKYADSHPSFHVEDSPWKAQLIAEMIDRHDLRPQTVAEVGCGAGEILRQLRLRYSTIARFHGYEISPQAYEMARPREDEKLTFSNTDLLTVVDAHYDLLLCIDVVEHVEHYLAFLRGLRRYASAFIFHFPLDMNVQMVLRANPLLYVREKVGHIHYFSRHTALASLRDTGYTVIDWRYTPSGLERPKSKLARMVQLPRTLGQMISPELTARILGGYSLLVLAK